MRISMLCQGCPDYLMDIVADGTIRLLGRENIHLRRNDAFPPDYFRSDLYHRYQEPNMFEIEEGEVLVASNRSDLPTIREWARKTGRPVAIVDGEDDLTIRDSYREFATVYFKREVLDASVRPNLAPLPFGAFPEPIVPSRSRTRPVVFMGNATSPMREEIWTKLREGGFDAGGKFISKDEYNALVVSSSVGISAKGAGWDTYRYWETPYFGAVLLAQRVPILIPGNFTDEEAVFFDTADECISKLRALLDDPSGTRATAVRGQLASHERHLSIHRAKTVLEGVAR
jgi:hypothetical protein